MNKNNDKLASCCELLKDSLPDENKKVPSLDKQMDNFANLVKILHKDNKLCSKCYEYYQGIKNAEDYVTRVGLDRLNKYFWIEEGNDKEKSSFQRRIEGIAIKHLYQLHKEVNEEAKRELGYEFAKKDIEKLLDFMKKVLNSRN